MTQWSHGYNVSSGYTYGFYRELAPDWLDICALIQGVSPPQRGPKGEARYLELGCGQGFGLILLAAANPAMEFVGVDFHPGHISHARWLVGAAGLDNVRFIEGDFAALGREWPADLGQFDYVALHGILSWIPVRVRAPLVAALGAATRPGALVYVSHNCPPGWLSAMPFQHVARQLQTVTGMAGGKALAESARLFEAMAAANAPYSKAQPALASRLEKLGQQSPSYLVQEYLHDEWNLLWFSQVAAEFAGVKLDFVGSAHLPEALMPALLPAPMRDLVTGIDDLAVRMDVMDSMLNNAFRRDVYARGGLQSFDRGQRQFMGRTLMLSAPPLANELKVATAAGEARVGPDIVGPIVEALAVRPMTIAELVALPALPSAGPNAHVQALILMLHAGLVQLVAGGADGAEPAQRLNRAVAAAVADGAPYSHLAAPALATAVHATDIDLLMLAAWSNMKQPGEVALAGALQSLLAALGRGLSHKGQALSGEALTQRLSELAANFLQKTLPRWRGLGVVQ